MKIPRDTWGRFRDETRAGWKVVVQETVDGERYILKFPPAPSTDVFNDWAADEDELEAWFDKEDVVWDGVGPPADDKRLAPPVSPVAWVRDSSRRWRRSGSR